MPSSSSSRSYRNLRKRKGSDQTFGQIPSYGKCYSNENTRKLDEVISNFFILLDGHFSSNEILKHPRNSVKRNRASSRRSPAELRDVDDFRPTKEGVEENGNQYVK